MILQALTDYYETLLELPPNKSKPPRFGWSQTNVRFAVFINSAGTLKNITLLESDTNKNGRPTAVPMQLKRSGTKPPPYFLCDTATYVLGIDKEGEITARSKAYFTAFSSYNKDILSHIDCLEARAVINFLDNWDIESALSNPIVQDALPYDLGKGNLAFYITDTNTWVLDSPKIQTGWDMYYQESNTQGCLGVCLVTGKDAPIARIHNSIKKLRTSSRSPNGWTLVGFDKGSPAFSSYGKEQGYNAPTSEYVAFAYTTALNHLLDDQEHVYQLGDTTVVCWARGGGDAYQSFFGGALLGAPMPYSAADLRGMTAQLCQGIPVDFQEDKLDPNMDFYILGLSPNAARLSVRFFLHNTFQGFLDHIQAHYDRLEIAQSNDNKFDNIPLWRLLYATVRSQTKYEPSSYKEAKQNLEKYLPPELSGEILRSILMNTRYPATLLNGITLRIRAEHEITRSRAAAIKACLLQNYRCLPIYSTLREVLTVELNDSCNYQPYVLGRLFAVMEQIQLASADWKLNRTIKDSYFTSAATTPKNIYAKLFPLSEYHMKKLLRDKPGLANILGKEKGSLIGKLTAPIPPRFMPEETDCFYIGYYHQSNQKKEEKEHV